MQNNRVLTVVGVAAVLALVLAVAGVPLTALIPLAVVLACPLMMFFMMRSMGGMHHPEERHPGGPDSTVSPPSRQG